MGFSRPSYHGTPSFATSIADDMRSLDIGSPATAYDPRLRLNKRLPLINYDFRTMTAPCILTMFHRPSATPHLHPLIRSTTTRVLAIRASALARDLPSVFLIADSVVKVLRHPLDLPPSIPTDGHHYMTLTHIAIPLFLPSEVVDNPLLQMLRSVPGSITRRHVRMGQSRHSQLPPRQLFGMN